MEYVAVRIANRDASTRCDEYAPVDLAATVCGDCIGRQEPNDHLSFGPFEVLVEGLYVLSVSNKRDDAVLVSSHHLLGIDVR